MIGQIMTSERGEKEDTKTQDEWVFLGIKNKWLEVWFYFLQKPEKGERR